MIEKPSEYMIAILQLMNNLPLKGERASNIVGLFIQTYSTQIPQEDTIELSGGKFGWEEKVLSSLSNLARGGLVSLSSRGYWQLTKKGHSWLMEHPGIMQSFIKNDMPSPPQEFVITQPKSYLEFFDDLKIIFQDSLRPIFDGMVYQFVQNSNYLQIRLTSVRGCHYEIILHRDIHEIALHFESSADRNQARLRDFQPHIDALSRSLDIPVFAGDFQSRGWTQVRIEKQAQPFFREYVTEFSELVLRFISVTFPILQQIIANERTIQRPPPRKEIITATSPAHAILEQEIKAIRDCLQGRTGIQTSSEKLCDWVNFCYTFELYVEGDEIFSLVDKNEVQPWYYERTKKIAKICEMRSRSV